MKKFLGFIGILALIKQVGKLLEKLIVKIKELFTNKKKSTNSKEAN